MKPLKPLTLHPCGTCDLTVPIEGATDGSMWCHGAPPDAYRNPVVVVIDGKPTHEERFASAFPPVGKDKPGCALHPMVRKKLGRAG